MAPRRLALVVALLLEAGHAQAQSFDFVALSPDVTVMLDGLVFDDDQIAVDNGLGITLPVSLGVLPEGAAVTAYHSLPNGDRLFALDITSALTGGVMARPRDVVRFDGSAYALEFDGGAAGVPAGAAVDAVSTAAAGGLLLSFDTTVALPGGVVARDEDLVRWSGGSFNLAFDASAAGVSEALDLDAAHDLGSGRLGLSFDASGSAGGAAFDDEDVLLYDPSGPAWLVAYNGSVAHADLAGADVEAVFLPEPAALVPGMAALLGLLRSSRGRRRLSPEGQPARR